MSPGLALVLSGACLLGGAAHPADVEKEFDQLQGTWEVVTVAAGGEDFSYKVGERDRLEIQRNKGILYDKRAREFDISLDPSKKPKAIDLTATEGGQKETCPGIYQVDGDRLDFTYAIPGEPRPKDFISRKEQKSVVFVLKRLPAGEKTAREKLQVAEEAAVAFRAQGQLGPAARAFEEAVTRAREIFGRKSFRAACLMNVLAALYNQQGFYSQSEPLWIETLEILEMSNDASKRASKKSQTTWPRFPSCWLISIAPKNFSCAACKSRKSGTARKIRKRPRP